MKKHELIERNMGLIEMLAKASMFPLTTIYAYHAFCRWKILKSMGVRKHTKMVADEFRITRQQVQRIARYMDSEV